MNETLWGILLIPFAGTSVGAALVFCLRRGFNPKVGRGLNGFAAGVMVAASVWSLILPAIEQSAYLGRLAFLPAVAGVWGGILFLLALERAIPRLQAGAGSRTTRMVLAVTLHNLPEGMAVGVAAAGWLMGDLSAAAALALSIGIGLQNLPEGAIVSMPLRASGMGRGRAFACGVASGVIEPIGAVVTVLLAGLIVPILPVLLSFAAGAMLFVVVQDLIPEIAQGDAPGAGALYFALGFTLMMLLDVALG